MSISYVDLSQDANYRVEVELSGVPYTLVFRWFDKKGFWSMSIYSEDGAPLVLGARLVFGYDLLYAYNVEGMPTGSLYLLHPDASNREEPNYEYVERYLLVYVE